MDTTREVPPNHLHLASLEIRLDPAIRIATISAIAPFESNNESDKATVLTHQSTGRTPTSDPSPDSPSRFGFCNRLLLPPPWPSSRSVGGRPTLAAHSSHARSNHRQAVPGHDAGPAQGRPPPRSRSRSRSEEVGARCKGVRLGRNLYLSLLGECRSGKSEVKEEQDMRRGWKGAVQTYLEERRW